MKKRQISGRSTQWPLNLPAEVMWPCFLFILSYESRFRTWAHGGSRSWGDSRHPQGLMCPQITLWWSVTNCDLCPLLRHNADLSGHQLYLIQDQNPDSSSVPTGTGSKKKRAIALKHWTQFCLNQTLMIVDVCFQVRQELKFLRPAPWWWAAAASTNNNTSSVSINEIDTLFKLCREQGEEAGAFKEMLSICLPIKRWVKWVMLGFPSIINHTPHSVTSTPPTDSLRAPLVFLGRAHQRHSGNALFK